MKRLFFLAAVLLMSASAFAYDTFFFRVKVDPVVQTKGTVQTVFRSKGKQVDAQPFYATHVLNQSDTNYVLVQITPQTDPEFQETKTLFGLPNTNLWKQFRITDISVENIVDNSKSFPVNHDWSLKSVDDSKSIKP